MTTKYLHTVKNNFLKLMRKYSNGGTRKIRVNDNILTCSVSFKTGWYEVTTLDINTHIWTYEIGHNKTPDKPLFRGCGLEYLSAHNNAYTYVPCH